MADKLITDRIKKIGDFDAPELDIYARFTEAQLLNKDRPEDGLFIAESPKVILRALDAGYLPVSILTEERHIEGESREVIARCRDIPVYTAGFDVLTRLTGFPLTRGMLCAMHRKPLPSAEEICRSAKRIAVLENVMNPTNVGAIIRSAYARMQQSFVPEGGPGKYGNSISDSLVNSGRRRRRRKQRKRGQ